MTRNADDANTQTRAPALGARIRGLLSPDARRHGGKGPWWRPSAITLVGLAILAALVSLRVWDPTAVETARVKTFDLYNRLKPRIPADPSPVVIVDIDEKSLKELGQFPWSRTVIADLVTAARDYGMAVVGFDIAFPEPDRTSPGVIAETIPGVAPDTVAALKALPTNDQILAEAMETMRTVVGQASTKAPPLATPPEAAMQSSVLGWRGGHPNDFIFANPTLIHNRPELEAAALGRGVFSVEDEVDGVVRRVPIVMNIQGVIKPTLSLEMLRVGFGGNSIFVGMNEGGVDRVVLQVPGTAGFPVPTDGDGRVWIYFAEPDASNSPSNEGRLYVSATDLINKRVPVERLQGRLALVGASAVGLLDIRATPIEPRLPGVEVHANLIEAILQQQYLQHPVEMHLTEIFVMLIAGLFLLYLVPRFGPFLSLGFLALVAGTTIGTSWFLFSQKLVLLDASYPTAAAILLYAFLAFANYTRDAAEKKQVRGAFAQYLSPDLVEQLAQDPDKLQLGGETKRMTLLFCDVRGFTAISERYKADPQGLTVLINRLLTPLTDRIMQTGGTIDKYMGDCIMAFWNAPLDVPDQEKKACRAALDMFAALDALNAERKAEAEASGERFLPLNIGVGLNTGDVVVGNMGSEQRFDYSVLGDAVNLAARLEGQSKNYGVDIVVGADTAEAASEDFALLELDLIAVKGKTEAVRVYCLLGDQTMRDSASFEALQSAHDAYLTAYRTQEWDKAETIAAQNTPMLNGAMANFYAIYGERIADYRKAPPPGDWDGVFVATSK
ncbi:MAG: adenylate/guanylate cyclase domain-containing protein [Alphaproteobacteria bacterium]|nr:adenylate/guanylate cyclase domain-containing protein [Alphaproteobacteria bacterium]